MMLFFLIPSTSPSSFSVMFWQNLWYLAKYLARKELCFSIFLTDPSLIILWSLPCLLNSWFCSKSLLELFGSICK